MFEDTRPAPLPAGDGREAWQDFRITHPGELLATLRQLRDSGVPVQLSGPQARGISASLWSADEASGRLNFSIGSADKAAAAMVESDELTAVAYLDSVKLQFELVDPVLVHGNESTTLQAAWPSEMYRFQRRNAYRVRTLERSSPTALLRHPALPDMALALRVIDVSIGGCAIFVPHDVPPLEPGTRVHGVRIELDADTRFDAALSLQHVTDIHPEQRGVRIGCEWQNLSSSAEKVLQRYIDQTQKRRRMLSLS
jgi:c-di-GMP-binding flagellar brake protein YcgR